VRRNRAVLGVRRELRGWMGDEVRMGSRCADVGQVDQLRGTLVDSRSQWSSSASYLGNGQLSRGVKHDQWVL
jgi:hypothetical protein